MSENERAIIEESNQQKGSWLPNVDRCQNIAQPCGNALCADEAMRAGSLEAGGLISRIQAGYAFIMLMILQKDVKVMEDIAH